MRSAAVGGSVATFLAAVASVGCSGDETSGGGDMGTATGSGGATSATSVTTVAPTSSSTTGGTATAAAAATSGAGTTTGGVAMTGTTGASSTTGAAGASSTSTSMTGGTPVACNFTVNPELSSAIATVAVVTWSTDLAGVTDAHIEFGPSDAGFTMSAPVDLAAQDNRTLLLGMKAERDYSFQIVATAGQQTCTSEMFSLTTGSVSDSVPAVGRQVDNQAAVAPGFFVTASGLGNGGGGNSMAFILDADGDVVWWSEAPGGTGRVQMNWAGTELWMASVNNGGGDPNIRRVSLDGLEVEDITGVGDAHHDFTAHPDGSMVFIVHLEGGNNGCSAIVKRSPEGTVTNVVADVSTLYQPVGECHPNAIHYYPVDDTYTISDRNPNLFVKFASSGELRWQFGGSNPLGPHIPGSWQVNHGHHLLDDGHFLFFNNNGQGGGGSAVWEFALDSTAMTADEVWSYTSNNDSGTLGDVQRLRGGNTIITYSNDGVIQELDAAGNLVQSLSTDSLGYTQHRPTLYGPPPR